MKEATVAIEDQRFYEHRGVDFQGIGRAVRPGHALRRAPPRAPRRSPSSSSRTRFAPRSSRTVFEKLREAALAYQLERHWDKDKILTEYLNEIYFGEGAYGIEAAAKTYFGWNHPGCGGRPDRCASRPPALGGGDARRHDLQPQRLRPGDQSAGRAMARRNQVLQNMVDQGYITQEEYNQYSKEPLPKPQPDPDADGELQGALLHDLAAPAARRQVRRRARRSAAACSVNSTLDLPFQDAVQKIAYDHTAGVGLNSAVVVLDNQTGGVRAMVGGTDYSKTPFNLATQGHRQPGSSFKPFTLVTALEQGHSPDQVFTVGPAEAPVQGEGAEEGRRDQGRTRDLRRAATTATSTSAAHRSRRRPLTPTTRSTRSWAHR